jgi:hypothetical protein
MKKLTLFLSLFFIGCASPLSFEISYTVSSERVMTITHRTNGNTCRTKLKTLYDVKRYKESLQKLIKAVEEFEEELITTEKTK